MTVSPALALAGIHKLTTLDYPGLLAAIVFTQGCNFRCPYCHNPQLIAAGPGELNPARVTAFLEKRAGLLDGLVISGGEPTLQPGLTDFCRTAKALGYQVKLDTNGSRPDIVRALIDKHLIDYAAMDCKTTSGLYSELCPEKDIQDNVLRCAALLRESGLPHEFRTTCVTQFVGSGNLQELLHIVGEESPWFLQRANLNDGMNRRGLQALSAEDIDSLLEAAKTRRAEGATLQRR